MDGSFTQWRQSPRKKADSNSFIISDSDDEVVVSDVGRKNHLIIESSDNDSASQSFASRGSHGVRDSPVITKSAIRRRLKQWNAIESEEDSFNAAHSANTSVNPDGPNESHESHESDESDDSDEADDSTEEEGGSEEVEEEEEEKANLVPKAKSNKSNNPKSTLDVTTESMKDLELSSEASTTDAKNLSKGNSSNEDNNTTAEDDIAVINESHDDSYEEKPIVSINLDGTNSPEPEMAISLARQEIGVGNIDPLTAQKRALLVCKMQQLQNQLAKTKLLLTTANIKVLPDKGEKLRESIRAQEEEIHNIAHELEQTPLVESIKREPFVIKQEPRSIKTELQERIEEEYRFNPNDPENIVKKPTSFSDSKELGKKAQETLNRELALTVERLQDMHGSLVARPSEDEKANDPRGLKIKLMPHQQHALAWLLWREQQRPAGGVLADDMGLGKTLTMISLILTTLATGHSEDSDDENEWVNHNAPLRHKGGTLVVCPASLLSQWESEVRNRCKRGTLSVEVYHGTNRESVPKRLAKNDIVITTYNLLAREFKSKSTVYRIQWKRVILDEAHIVRNHKSQASAAVCGLLASKRWALTGTPIQNKEMDLYSILKFLKCSPFDDIRVWKRWVDNKNSAGHQRLATVMKTLMLRRTKSELQQKGELQSLPDKCIEEVSVKLDPEEQLVYEKVLVYSRTLFAQFLAQRAEKDHMIDLNGGKYDRPSFLSNPNKNTQFTKAQNELLSLHADVKAHEILMLLLRLRQICCHPALIHAMLDQEDMQHDGIVGDDRVFSDITSKVNNMTLENSNEDEKEEEIGIDRRVVSNLLTAKNPVFDENRVSSKMRAVLSTVEEVLEKGDKLIIVSQWVSMLEVVASHLSTIEGATYEKFTGSVPIKNRQGIMDEFNNREGGPKILLLSLTAGGVGLNLVGGNHLLLIDIHWNPQLETQAQDRIYRFGQTKSVYIYKFICKDTIEQRIQALQDRKLEIADNILSGDSKVVSKLTLNDLKSLFAL